MNPLALFVVGNQVAASAAALNVAMASCVWLAIVSSLNNR